MSILGKDDPMTFLRDTMAECIWYMRWRQIPIADPDRLSLEIGDPKSMKGASGYCICRQGDPNVTGACYTIRIRSTVLSLNVPENIRRGILIHELIHTVPECFEHNARFRQYAALSEHDDDGTAYHICDHFSAYYIDHFQEADGCILTCPACGCRHFLKAAEMDRLYKRGVVDMAGRLNAQYEWNCAECGHALEQEKIFPFLQAK